jgi:gluconate 2-dehydrogenase gamma chain
MMKATTSSSYSSAERSTIEAICERMFPPTASWLGAKAAGVPTYVASVSGDQLSYFYREGIADLDNESMATFGSRFSELAPQKQDAILERAEKGDATAGLEAGRRLEAFFGVVWEHAIQGMFCDPQYGGNRDSLGWKLVGFPGAQWGYNAEQMKEGFDSRVIVIKTLLDLKKELQAKNA